MRLFAPYRIGFLFLCLPFFTNALEAGNGLFQKNLSRAFSFPTLMMISPAVRRIWARMKSIGRFRITGRGREYSSEARDNSVQNLHAVIGESGKFEFEMRRILK